MPRPDATVIYEQRAKRAGVRKLLRPRSGIEVLTAGLDAYRSNAGTLLATTAPWTALVTVAIAFLGAYVTPGLLSTQNPGDVLSETVDLGTVIAISLFLVVPTIVFSLGQATEAVTEVVADTIHGDGSWRKNRKGRTAGLSAVYGLVQGIGVALLPGVLALIAAIFGTLAGKTSWGSGWAEGAAGIMTFLLLSLWTIWLPTLASWYSLASVVSIVEGVRPSEAARRSKALTRAERYHANQGFTMFGMLVTAVVVGGFLASFIGLMLKLVGLEALVGQFIGPTVWRDPLLSVLSLLPFFVASWLVLPWILATQTVSYFDRRIRLEAYDIATLVEDVRRENRRSG